MCSSAAKMCVCLYVGSFSRHIPWAANRTKPDFFFSPKYVLCIDMFGMCLIGLSFFGETVTLNAKQPGHWRRECRVMCSFNNVTFDQI